MAACPSKTPDRAARLHSLIPCLNQENHRQTRWKLCAGDQASANIAVAGIHSLDTIDLLLKGSTAEKKLMKPVWPRGCLPAENIPVIAPSAETCDRFPHTSQVHAHASILPQPVISAVFFTLSPASFVKACMRLICERWCLWVRACSMASLRHLRA